MLRLPSNLNRQKEQTYFQTKSRNWNKIPARYPARNSGEMEILQKSAVRTSNSFDVLSNLKDAQDYHQSKIKRNLHHGSGKNHSKYNFNEQISYTIPVLSSGNVPTNILRIVIDTEGSVNGATITKRKIKKNVPPNDSYQKKTLSVNSSKRKNHKILMTGDSHVINCATELKQNPGANF